jgi:radical SAM superfamily enzyme
MPMTKNTDYGTNRDGEMNKDYCTFCYKEGKFTDEGTTLEQKIEKNVQIAVKMGWTKEKARQIAESTIPKLRRWRK